VRARASQAVQSDSRTSFAVDCADARSTHYCGPSDVLAIPGVAEMSKLTIDALKAKLATLST